MKASTLQLAVAQSFCTPGDIEGNIRRMTPLVEIAARDGARVVLFSEMGVTGYTPIVPPVSSGDPHWETLREMAGDLRIAVAAGFLEACGSDRFIAHAVFQPDGNVSIQRKARAARIEMEIPGFRLGPPSRTIVSIDGWRLAISICAEAALPGLAEQLHSANVDLLLAPTAGGGSRRIGFSNNALDDPAVLDRYLAAAESVCFSREAVRFCRSHRIAMATCNHLADDGIDYFHPGHSMIIDSEGRLAGLIPGCFVFEHLREQSLTAQIALRRKPDR